MKATRYQTGTCLGTCTPSTLTLHVVSVRSHSWEQGSIRITTSMGFSLRVILLSILLASSCASSTCTFLQISR